MFDRFLILRGLQVAYHTPPRYPIDVTQNIREGASILFKRLGLRDFARIDGWFLPSSSLASSSSENKFGKTESGTIIFTDINLVRHQPLSSYCQITDGYYSYHVIHFYLIVT